MTLSPNSAGRFVTMNITSGGEASRKKSPSSRSPQPPQCNAEWGIGQLLPAAGTIAHTNDHCTKRSHCNRFDECTTLGAAPASAPAWAAASEWAVASVGTAAPDWAAARQPP